MQGFGRKYTRNSLNHRLLSSSLPKPFLQVNNARNTFRYRHSSSSFPSKTSRGIISAEAWDFGRFLKTLYFFNGPPSPAKVSRVSCVPIFLLFKVEFCFALPDMSCWGSLLNF